LTLTARQPLSERQDSMTMQERVGRTWVEIYVADVAVPCLRCKSPTQARVKFRASRPDLPVCGDCR
jgi:hypothetical protein